LKPTNNYTSLYDQKNKVSLWNLSACQPYKFENKTWYFPFLGSFGYKGFFDLSQAQIEREYLEKEGFDTRIRSVNAWSTLGWFKDPILSNLLNKTEAQIAETLFHELTHNTLFFKNRLQFNENLASFFGKKTSIDYLNFFYGPNAEQMTDYLSDLEDSEKFRQHILRGKQILDVLYQSFAATDDLNFKAAKKNKTIRNIVNHLDTIQFSNINYYSIFNESLPNNTYFMSYTRYYAEEQELDSIFNYYEKDLKKFITHFE
jgi:predicted aminopeptidase